MAGRMSVPVGTIIFTGAFASPMGMALLAIALGMQAAGIVAVRRMLAVEVG